MKVGSGGFEQPGPGGCSKHEQTKTQKLLSSLTTTVVRLPMSGFRWHFATVRQHSTRHRPSHSDPTQSSESVIRICHHLKACQAVVLRPCSGRSNAQSSKELGDIDFQFLHLGGQLLGRSPSGPGRLSFQIDVSCESALPAGESDSAQSQFWSGPEGVTDIPMLIQLPHQC